MIKQRGRPLETPKNLLKFLAGVSKTIAAVAVATAFRVLYWWRQHCKQISNGRLEIFKKIITLLTVTVLFLFTFLNLILDAPRTWYKMLLMYVCLHFLSVGTGWYRYFQGALCVGFDGVGKVRYVKEVWAPNLWLIRGYQPAGDQCVYTYTIK